MADPPAVYQCSQNTILPTRERDAPVAVEAWRGDAQHGDATRAAPDGDVPGRTRGDDGHPVTELAVRMSKVVVVHGDSAAATLGRIPLVDQRDVHSTTLSVPSRLGR